MRIELWQILLLFRNCFAFILILHNGTAPCMVLVSVARDAGITGILLIACWHLTTWWFRERLSILCSACIITAQLKTCSPTLAVLQDLGNETDATTTKVSVGVFLQVLR